MAAIDWDAVVALASELAATAPDAQDTILAHVNTALQVTAFGGETSPRLKMARVLLAAHMATSLAGGGETTAGPLVSETLETNSISRTYAQGGVGQSDYATTSYGRQYLAIVRTSGGRFPRVL